MIFVLVMDVFCMVSVVVSICVILILLVLREVV